MRILQGVTVPLILVLASCTAVPNLRQEDTLSIADVVENIACEFQEAGNKDQFLTEKYGWTIGAEIQMQVVNGMETVVDSSYAVPTSSIFLPGIGGSYSGKADATRAVGITLDYSKKDKVEATKRDCDMQARRSTGKRLQGSLGLAEWIATIQKTINATGVVPNKASFNLEFTLDRSAYATSGLGNITNAFHVWKITPKITSNDKHVHRLIVALTQNAPPEKPATITIVGADGKQKLIQTQRPSGVENLDRNQNYLQSITPRSDTSK